MTESKAIDTFRRQFFIQRLESAKAHGVTLFDQAVLLLKGAKNGKDVIVTDSFSVDGAHGSIQHFIAGIASSWWLPRQKGGETSLSADVVSGFYAHFLPQVGFDIIFEFSAGAQVPSVIWRLDARGNADCLPMPKDDGEFRDQTGTFFDLRFGWSWLAQSYIEQGGLVAAEVESGYVIGIRRGLTDATADPYGRLDQDIDELAQRYGTSRFDCVEILNQELAHGLPFESEMFAQTLVDTYLSKQDVELFVLASSHQFFNMVEEFADQSDVLVEMERGENSDRLVISKGELRQEIDFAYPFLRTIFSARSFPAGVRAYVNPVIEQVSAAAEILERLQTELTDYAFSVDNAGIATVRNLAGETVARCNLFRLSGQLWTGTEKSNADLIALVGIDPETRLPMDHKTTLDNCRICGVRARVSKNIRPRYSIGDQSQRFAGLATEQHLIYYVQECALHTIPLELEPDLGYAELEAAYQAGLARSTVSLLQATEVTPGKVWSFIGHDVASTVLEPGRITELLRHFNLQLEAVWALAFYPDALIISNSKPNPETLERLRHQTRESLHDLYPDRLWLIDMIREIDRNTPPVGSVELAS